MKHRVIVCPTVGRQESMSSCGAAHTPSAAVSRRKDRQSQVLVHDGAVRAADRSVGQCADDRLLMATCI